MLETTPLFQTIEQPNLLTSKPNLKAHLSFEDQKHLFHKAGRISQFIRKTMFFPYSAERGGQKALSSAKLFWETSYYDRDYPYKKQIRDHFNRFEQYIEMEKEGKKLRLKCLVIEPKEIGKDDLVNNHLIVQGNTSNLENNTPGIVPFLEAYLREKEKNSAAPLGRFVIFNHYDHEMISAQGSSKSYLPGDMDEWGFLFKKTLETLSQNYGKFHTISAHSLGNIPIIAQLKHFSKKDFETLFPKTLFLSKGPSSLYEVSKNIPFQLGVYPWGWLFLISPILYLLAKATGWTLELDETLVNYLKEVHKDPSNINKLEQTSIIISEVKHDYYFPGKASLCGSKKIKDLKNIPLNLYRVSFNPPPTRTTKQGQHNYNPGSLQRQYVYNEKLYKSGDCVVKSRCPLKIFQQNVENIPYCLQHGESLPDLVLRTSVLREYHDNTH